MDLNTAIDNGNIVIDEDLDIEYLKTNDKYSGKTLKLIYVVAWI